MLRSSSSAASRSARCSWPLAWASAIGTVYLIALPIWDANVGTDVPANPRRVNPADPDAPQRREPRRSSSNMNRITWGIAMLLGYAALSVYLNSPPIKREFTKR